MEEVDWFSLSVKKGWLRHSLTEILLQGSFYNILHMRLNAGGSIFV